MERLQEFFVYDQETGDLRWRSIPTNFRRAKVGDEVGTIGARGYRVVGIAGGYYLVHRIVWKIMKGGDPVDQIDHADGDRLNNRWANLRAASNGENRWNTKLAKNNTSGVKGVCWDAGHQAWLAYIAINRKQTKLGRFKSFDAAVSKVASARLQLHGDFAHF